LRGRHLQTALATPDDASSHHEWRHARVIACTPTTPWLVSETRCDRRHRRPTEVHIWDGLEALEDAYDIEAVSSPSGVTHLSFTRKVAS